MDTTKLKEIIEKYFTEYPIKIDLVEINEKYKLLNLSIEQFEELIKEIKVNIKYFENELGIYGMTLSNLFTYASDAKYLNEKQWRGSKNRIRITKGFHQLLMNKQDIEKDATKASSFYEKNAIQELNDLIGLKTIKEEIFALTSLAKIRRKKQELGLPVNPSSLHLVFTGNPGTGKTTVDRLIGAIYQSIGLLESGHVIETSRKDLIGKYVGHTAPMVVSKFGEAIGGILFIDEAYSLSNNKGSNDFGAEAIQTLLKLMEDNRENIVVIVAGYPKEMNNFLNSNPGLSSRFSTHINFEDYNSEELMQIFKLMASRDGHILSDAAIAKLDYILSEKIEIEGNARFIRNLYERVLKNQAMRLSKLNELTKVELQKIDDIDIPNEI